MKCERCGSEKITIVNQPIQLKDKTDSVIVDIFTAISILILIVGIIGFFITSNQPANTELEKVPFYLTSLALMKWSGITLIAIGILNALRPHKIENKLICVCLECGYSAELRQPTTPQKENPPTQNLNGK